jgi:hypothetical protein
VHTLSFNASKSGADAAAAWVKQLAASKLRPRRLVLTDDTHILGVITSPEAAAVWQGVQAVQIPTRNLTGALTNVGHNCLTNLQC